MAILTKLSPLKTALALGLSALIAGCSASTHSSTTTHTALSTGHDDRDYQTESFAPKYPQHVTKTGEVILLRGLANVFSRGMDVIGDRLQAKGVNAVVYNHNAWERLAKDLVKRNKEKKVSYPVIIMGHSLGGNASVQMATYLGQHGVPVSYVVAFDPTVTTVADKNVKKVVNYYLPNGKNRVHKGPRFRGTLSNVNVSSIPDIVHTNVEKNPTLQRRVIRNIMAMVRRLPKKRRKRG